MKVIIMPRISSVFSVNVMKCSRFQWECEATRSPFSRLLANISHQGNGLARVLTTAPISKL